MKLCLPAQPQTKKDEYCNLNFNTDPDENEDCNILILKIYFNQVRIQNNSAWCAVTMNLDHLQLIIELNALNNVFLKMIQKKQVLYGLQDLIYQNEFKTILNNINNLYFY